MKGSEERKGSKAPRNIVGRELDNKSAIGLFGGLQTTRIRHNVPLEEEGHVLVAQQVGAVIQEIVLGVDLWRTKL
jgi:hypothetical protein